MKRIFLIAALFAMPALSAQAQVTADQLATAYQSDGYSRIEVTRGLDQIKVEAIKGEQKIEVIYDAVSGDILKSETSTVGANDNTRPGVKLRNKNRNFVKDGDNNGSDDNGSNDDSDDNGSDDNGSDDNGSDDNGSDDNGSDDNGSDDNGSDDNGSDDNGSDDHGSDNDNGSDDNGSDDNDSNDD